MHTGSFRMTNYSLKGRGQIHQICTQA